MVLESHPDFQVVGEAGDGLETIRLVEQIKPDVLVVDLMMPGVNGMEVIRQVCKLTRVVVLTMHDQDAYVVEALRNGALGYVLKDATTIELVEAIRQVANGKQFLSTPFSARASELCAMVKNQDSGDPYDSLTGREREILQLVGQGYSNQEAGKLLQISVRTVEVHRARLMRKLGIKSQTELIRYAIERGLVTKK